MYKWIRVIRIKFISFFKIIVEMLVEGFFDGFFFMSFLVLVVKGESIWIGISLIIVLKYLEFF